MKMARNRLRKDLTALQRDPVPGISVGAMQLCTSKIHTLTTNPGFATGVKYSGGTLCDKGRR